MGWGKGKGRGIAAATAGLMVLLGVVALVPVHANATDSDLKHAYAFKLGASHGYSIFGFAASQRADGRGEIVLFVSRRNAGASYAARATVTASRIEADLGSLGHVSLDVVPSGHERTASTPCEEEPEKVTFEPWSYRGNFEFHGEQGYTEAITGSPRDYSLFFSRLICGSGFGSGETTGAALPGARLRLHSHQGSFRLRLQANKNRPAARTRFEVETHEKRQGTSISRYRTLWLGAGAFGYDPLLRTATLEPPAPFSGRASFHRNAAVAHRWTGNLTVDLPGRSNLPLTGTDVGATLAPACRQEGEGGFSC